jgi:O-antigen biosynthesis protein
MVSPLHAMFIDDVLVPAHALVNGRSIARDRDVPRVDYFHVELDTHDEIIAEGAPAETFIDDDSRGMFHNAREYRALYPDAVRTHPLFCAPIVEDGKILQDIRDPLWARAQAREVPGC